MARLDDYTQVFTNHNVYILGAGFSSDAGIPLLNDFLYEMRSSLNLLREMNREAERQAVVEVLTFRRQAASAALRVTLNVENIEDLFSLAAASSGPYAGEDQVSTAIAATIDCSRRPESQRFFEATVKDDVYRPNSWEVKSSGVRTGVYRIPFYDVYAGLLSGQACDQQPFMQNTVISLNYDTVLEESVAHWNVPVWYGFGEKSVTYDDTSNHARIKNGALPILKLHGSVNWARPNEEDETIRIYGSYSDIVSAGKQPLLVPPTWRKTFGGALSEVWNSAVKALTEATRIIIIGFSIPPTDIHIKFLLAAGLQENISLRNIYCFNPDSKVERNLFKIIRRELKTHRIIEFYPYYTRDLIIGNRSNGLSIPTLFNRDIRHNLENTRLG